MKAYLLADIGGTNARFAVVPIDDKSNQKSFIYAVRENPTLVGALKKFVAEHCAGMEIVAAALAVAGPVLGDSVKLTNSDWICDKQEIQKALGIEAVFILNDFEAIALAVSTLGKDDFSVLQTGQRSARHPVVVMGPGTGLGVAAMAPVDGGGIRAFTTESGHVRYAPANDREYKLIRILSREFSFVTAENLISGPGLVNLYKANCQLVDKPFDNLQPADVVARARQGDQLCRQVLDDFAAVFGSFASQIALSWNALGGIYLTGGVLQKMAGDFVQERFFERFATNPNMAGLLSRMPVYRVHADIPAFAGLTAFLDGKKIA